MEILIVGSITNNATSSLIAGRNNRENMMERSDSYRKYTRFTDIWVARISSKYYIHYSSYVVEKVKQEDLLEDTDSNV